jgi:hypothetical protein
MHHIGTKERSLIGHIAVGVSLYTNNAHQKTPSATTLRDRQEEKGRGRGKSKAMK